MDEEGRHLAYLIRLWRVGDDKTATWHTSLQDVRTGQRRGFADLEAACHFSCAQIKAASAGAEEPTAKR